MPYEEIFNFLQKLESNLGRGLDDSVGAIGLTREDSVKFTELRDSVVFTLALIKINKAKIIKEEVSNETTKTKE